MKILNKIVYLALVMLVVFVIVGCKKKEEKYELYKINSLITNEESTLFEEYDYYYITLDFKNLTIQLEHKLKSSEKAEIRNGTFTISNNDIIIMFGNETIKAKMDIENDTIIVNLIVLEFYYKKIN